MVGSVPAHGARLCHTATVVEHEGTDVRRGADNVADLVRRSAERVGDRPALVFAGHRLTWAGLDAQVDRAAAALRGLGLAEGDRVVLQLGNTPDFAVCYFGALRAGLVAVPTNSGYTVPELRHVIADSGARVLVSATVAIIDARAELPGVTLLVPGRIAPEGALALEELLAAANGPVASIRGGPDLALLIYTSGTGGRPKGAMLSHRALLANIDQCARISPPPMIPSDVVLLVLPLFHIYGLNAGLGLMARTGATGLLMERFDPVLALEAMAREGVTNVIGAPAMYGAWAQTDPAVLARGMARVRMAVSGAALLPAPVQQTLARLGVAIYDGYGLTETAPVLTSTAVRGRPIPGSVGWPLPGVELRLLDPAGDPVEDDDPGEIVVRGENLFDGYWPDASDGPDAEGWWATGDIGYLDDDGGLHMVARSHDMILVSGFNVYPAEVEAVLDSHPDVQESAVIGVPDEVTGEAVAAFVVRQPGASVTARELLDHAARSLARFKLPVSVAFVATFPRSMTGKVRKVELRAFGAAAHEVDR